MTFFEGKTVLVTGGAGFIGSHLCERLIREGSRVVCFDDLSSGKMENIAGLREHDRFVFVQGDVNKRADLETVFQAHHIDLVFHGAAVLGVQRVIEDPLAVLRDLDGLRAIFELARAHGIKKLVFASSSEAYGEPVTLPEREEGPLNVNARDPYGLVKLIGENLCHIYWKKYSLPTTALRFFNVYGPRQESSAYGFVVGVFIRQVLAGQPPTIFGDGNQTRNFVYIDDNIEIVTRALASETANGETVNVGSGPQTTIRELAECTIVIAGANMKPVYLSEREIEIRYRSPDITKMQKLFGYVPQVSLDDGLRRTIEWYRVHVK